MERVDAADAEQKMRKLDRDALQPETPAAVPRRMGAGVTLGIRRTRQTQAVYRPSYVEE